MCIRDRSECAVVFLLRLCKPRCFVSVHAKILLPHSVHKRILQPWSGGLCPLRDAMRSPLPFPCVPDRPYKILLVQVGTLSFSHPSFGVPVLFIYYGNDATEEEVTRERTTRVGRPRGGMKVAARIGERLRKEIGRGRLPRVGDG